MNFQSENLRKSETIIFSQISSDDSGLGEIQNSEDEQTDSEVVILDDSGLKSTNYCSQLGIHRPPALVPPVLVWSAECSTQFCYKISSLHI